MHEKRFHTRRLMREDAALADSAGNARHPVILLDISRLGVSFTSPDLLEGGSRHMLDFHLPGQPDLHETVVQVIHCTSSGVPTGFRIGARFVHIAEETTEQIMNFVSSTAPA